MNEQQVNDFLIAGRNLAELWYKGKENELGLQAIQLTSMMVIPHLPKPRKVICQCKRQLTVGLEVAFYNNIGHCYNCEAALCDILD